ncbi:MAG: hypothetical protein AAFV62_07175, partial [Pseudomonadota bacterium]
MSDTADQHWNQEWAGIAADSKWLVPEPDVIAWADGLAPNARAEVEDARAGCQPVGPGDHVGLRHQPLAVRRDPS